MMHLGTSMNQAIADGDRLSVSVDVCRNRIYKLQALFVVGRVVVDEALPSAFLVSVSSFDISIDIQIQPFFRCRRCSWGVRW